MVNLFPRLSTFLVFVGIFVSLVSLRSVGARPNADTVVGKEVEDKSRTIVKIRPIFDSEGILNEFAVTVRRIDDLVNKENGHLLGLRVMQVVVDLDVDEKAEGLRLNETPVTLGVSDIEVEAVTAVVARGKEERDEIIKKFDKGIARVKVVAVMQRIVDEKDGLDIRRFIIRERVLEVNKESVEQKEAVEQVLDVKLVGAGNRQVIKHNPRIVPISEEEENSPPQLLFASTGPDAYGIPYARCTRQIQQLRARLLDWWHNIPLYAQGAIGFAFGSTIFFLFVALPALLYSSFRRRRNGRARGEGGYLALPADGEGEEKPSSVQNENTDCLPHYPGTAYISVSRDDDDDNETGCQHQH